MSIEHFQARNGTHILSALKQFISSNFSCFLKLLLFSPINRNPNQVCACEGNDNYVTTAAYQGAIKDTIDWKMHPDFVKVKIRVSYMKFS